MDETRKRQDRNPADPAGNGERPPGDDVSPGGSPVALASEQELEEAVGEILAGVEGVAEEPGEGTPGEPRDLTRAASIVESLLLMSTQPLGTEKIGEILGITRQEVRAVVARLKDKYPPEKSGILVEEIARGLQLRTNPANQEHVRRLHESKPPRFTRPALETLSVIAYKQPVTRLEIEQIRGVDCATSLKTLMERRLVKVVGKKDVAGRPFLFGTTREFLEVFGFASLSELPSMRDIEDFLAARTGGVVPEGTAQAELFKGVAAQPEEDSELAAELSASAHGEPLVSSAPEIPPGVSDDVLAGAAGAAGVGEGDEGPDVPHVIEAIGRRATDAAGGDETEQAFRGRPYEGTCREDAGEPFVSEIADAFEGVSDASFTDEPDEGGSGGPGGTG